MAHNESPHLDIHLPSSLKTSQFVIARNFYTILPTNFAVCFIWRLKG